MNLCVTSCTLTCNSCIASGLHCRLCGSLPLSPEWRHFTGKLGCVGDVGAVLLVGGCAESVITLSVWITDCRFLQLFRLLVESSSAVCWDFLPLKPAGQRCVSLEVKVPTAAVLLCDFLQLHLQISAQLVVVHRAEQTPAH